MIRRRQLALAFVYALAFGLFAAPLALAQEAPPPPAWPVDQRGSFPVDARRGREVALRFLTEGPDAPRPDVTAAQVDAADVKVVEKLCPRFTGLLLRVALADETELLISPAGRVLEYSAGQRRRCSVETPGRAPADVAAEATARCRPVEELRAAARSFLRARHRDFARRNFREVDHVLRTTSSPFEALFVLREEARQGELCVYMNVILIYVNPETAEVVEYLGEDVEAPVVTQAPPVTEARAREVGARAARAEVAFSALGYYMKGLVPVLTWRMLMSDDATLSVDATTAEVYSDDDEGR